MHKGVTMSAQIVVADLAAAAEDPAQLAQRIVSQMLAAGIKSSAAPYTVTIQQVAAVPSPSAPATPAPAPSPASSAAPGAGHYAVNVRLYIEGDVAPAVDFAAIGQRVVAWIFAAGADASAGTYTLSLGAVRALEGSDGDDDADDSSDS